MREGAGDGLSVTSPLRGEVDAQRRVRGDVQRARALRANATTAELKLWSILRNRQISGAKFVRQLPIGQFVADFVCREAALVIEADGGQHSATREAARTSVLNAKGYSVLRFWNNEILSNPSGVREAISLVLAGHPSPAGRFAPRDLSPEGRGQKGINAATAPSRSATRGQS